MGELAEEEVALTVVHGELVEWVGHFLSGLELRVGIVNILSFGRQTRIENILIINRIHMIGNHPQNPLYPRIPRSHPPINRRQTNIPQYLQSTDHLPNPFQIQTKTILRLLIIKIRQPLVPEFELRVVAEE